MHDHCSGAQTALTCAAYIKSADFVGISFAKLVIGELEKVEQAVCARGGQDTAAKMQEFPFASHRPDASQCLC